jgi:hypothetical protein
MMKRRRRKKLNGGEKEKKIKPEDSRMPGREVLVAVGWDFPRGRIIRARSLRVIPNVLSLPRAESVVT